MRFDRPQIRGGFPTWEQEPLPWLAVALVIGVALGGPRVVEASPLWVGAVALFLVAAVAGHRRGARLALLLGVGVFGAALGTAAVPPARLGRTAVVQGVVRDASGKTAVVDHPGGSVRLWFSDVAPTVGTRISAKTRPKKSSPRLPGAPDRQRTDRRTGRESRRVGRYVAIDPKRSKQALSQRFSEQRYGGVLWSLATGRRDALDPQDVALLRRTGTAHLLAVSGMHIGFVAGLGWGLGRCVAAACRRWRPAWRGRQLVLSLATVSGVLAACVYASAVGWPVSARRAVVMVVGAAVAVRLGRPIRSWSLLAAAAIALVVSDPDCVHGLGFGLSFGAVMGILAVTPRIRRWMPPDLPRPMAWTVDGLAVSVGAMVGTLPLTAWWFQSLSPWSPVANLVAGPLMGGVGVPAALVAVHGPEPVAGLALVLGDRAVAVAMGVLQWLDGPPWTPAVGPAGAGLLALALVARRHPPLWLGAVVWALWLPTWKPVDGLEVTVLAVGQGDAVFIRLPDGRRWLFDGGPPSRGVLEWLRREGHHHLDAVFLSHPDLDHLGGLAPVVESLSVGRFVTARPPRADEHRYRAVWQTLYARGIPIVDARWQPDGAGRLLHPSAGWQTRSGRRDEEKDNDESLVLLLEHEGRRILLPGDIERSAEAWLSPMLPEVDVVFAPHHGSRTSSSDAFVVATNPAWVVVSCGADNRFGHPHADTLAQWRGRQIARTDVHGTLRVRVDTDGLAVQQWSEALGYHDIHTARWQPRPPHDF